MRSSTIVSVLFGAGAFSTVIDRRALKVEDITITVTDYVTAGQAPAPTPAVKVAAVKAAAPAKPVQPHYHHHYHKQAAAAPAAPAPEPSSSKVDAVPAPKPTTTTTPKPVVQAPTTEAKAAPSPKTTKAPVKAAAPADTDNLPKTAVPNLDSGSETYKGLSLQHHNVHRSNHSVSLLAWNETLAGYAKTVAESCSYAHNRDPGNGNAPYPQGYGQNIAAGINPGQVAKVISNMWYNGEEPAYPTPYGSDSPDMTNFEVWGHYSQAVWASTESVGCYTSSCAPADVDPTSCKPDGSSYLGNVACGQGRAEKPVPAYFTVCNYYPAGNVVGGYHNVKAPGSMDTVCMNDQGQVTGM